MPNCSSCGNEIPEGQGKSCSMCYGDPYYGSDGYYLRELEKEAECEYQRKQEEEQQNQQNEE